MLLQRRTLTSITAWLLAIFIVPFLAVPLYYIVGIRKRKNFPKKTIVTLRRNNIPGTTENNNFILFTR